MEATLFTQGQNLLLALGWALAVAGSGRLLLSLAKLRPASPGEALFLGGTLGVMACGYAVFAMAAADLLTPRAMAFFLAALILCAAAGWWRPLRIDSSPRGERSSWDRPFGVAVAILLAGSFLLTLTPEIGKDALIYHLAVPKLYLLHHGFYTIPGNVFSGYPLLGEMHYLLALFLGNDVLAKLMNFAVLGAVLLGIALFSRHVFGNHAFPALSVLLFFSVPSVFAVSHTAYNDLFVTLFILAALYAFLRWSRERPAVWLILSAIFTGGAAACKYTALLAAPLGCLGTLYFARRWRLSAPAALRLLLLFGLTALIAGSPFYVKNWLVTGNPLYPFFHGIFGGLGWDSDQARLYDLFVQGLGMGREFLDYLLLPFNVSFRAKPDSPQFDGILGPIFLLTLPFLALVRKRETALSVILVYLFFSFLFWAFSAQQIRYLIPLIPLAALVTGAILTSINRRRPLFGLLMCIVAGCLIFNLYYISRDFLRTAPLRVSVGLESRHDFLARMLPPYPMYDFVNRHLPAEAKVFLIYMKNYTFLCERDCYADAMFEAHTLQKILRGAPGPEAIGERLKALGFTHLLCDERYLLGEPSPLSEEEKRAFLGFAAGRLLPIESRGSYRLFRIR
jgi:hypothetical protein